MTNKDKKTLIKKLAESLKETREKELSKTANNSFTVTKTYKTKEER